MCIYIHIIIYNACTIKGSVECHITIIIKALGTSHKDYRINTQSEREMEVKVPIQTKTLCCRIKGGSLDIAHSSVIRFRRGRISKKKGRGRSIQAQLSYVLGSFTLQRSHASVMACQISMNQATACDQHLPSQNTC